MTKIFSIYLITNKVNGKKYVGFSQDPEGRFESHVKNSERNSNLKLPRAIKKYGRENFFLEIIYQSKEKLHTINFVEDYFIKIYKTLNDEFGYNMCKGGMGGDIKTQEQKEKLSKRFKENNPSKKEKNRLASSERTKLLHKTGHFNKSENVQKKVENFLEKD